MQCFWDQYQNLMEEYVDVQEPWGQIDNPLLKIEGAIMLPLTHKIKNLSAAYVAIFAASDNFFPGLLTIHILEEAAFLPSFSSFLNILNFNCMNTVAINRSVIQVSLDLLDEVPGWCIWFQCFLLLDFRSPMLLHYRNLDTEKSQEINPSCSFCKYRSWGSGKKKYWSIYIQRQMILLKSVDNLEKYI